MLRGFQNQVIVIPNTTSFGANCDFQLWKTNQYTLVSPSFARVKDFFGLMALSNFHTFNKKPSTKSQSILTKYISYSYIKP